jgi:hypothetical protein
MYISSRTPDGDWNTCRVCGHHCKIVPACTPSRDAPCPRCGTLLWFEVQDSELVQVSGAEPSTAKPYEWPSFVAKVSDLPPTFLAEVEALLQPLIRGPQKSKPVREPSMQAARLIERLLRRGEKKFGMPWFWQRWAIHQIQDPYAAERLLALLHSARSWRELLTAWKQERIEA